jgi:oligopeptide/dipeptide ABC transporter ATP-binding protein
MAADTDILKIENLNIWFQMRQGFLKDVISKKLRYAKAVDGISFNIKKGEIFCLVGESGCGKTTTGKGILRLVEPTSGSIIFADEESDPVIKKLLHLAGEKSRKREGTAVVEMEGRRGIDIRKLTKSEMIYARQRIQMIFQDPYESLNPKMTIFDIIAEPLIVNKLSKDEKDKEARVRKALNDAGLRPPEFYMWRYPHQVSGGQRQRVGIAGALVLSPSLLVADEPISMLDVSIRGEILKLMLDLREKKRLSYLFITHDLSVAYVFSDRIGVMYLGRIVEMGPTEMVIKNPKHPYTQALITVVPKPDPTAKEEKIILKGERPDPTNIPPGCRFHPRCPYIMTLCSLDQPAETEAEIGHWAACYLLTPDLVIKWNTENLPKYEKIAADVEKKNIAEIARLKKELEALKSATGKKDTIYAIKATEKNIEKLDTEMAKAKAFVEKMKAEIVTMKSKLPSASRPQSS